MRTKSRQEVLNGDGFFCIQEFEAESMRPHPLKADFVDLVGLAMMGSRDRPEHVRTEPHKLDIPFEGGLSPHVLFSHPRHVKYTPDVARIILTNSNENLRLLEDVFHIGGEDYHLAISK